MNVTTRERINVLSNRARMVELSLDCERLNTLDDLWTAYLADPDNEAELEDNLPALQSLVAEMVSLLSSVSVKSRELSLLLGSFQARSTSSSNSSWPSIQQEIGSSMHGRRYLSPAQW